MAFPTQSISSKEEEGEAHVLGDENEEEVEGGTPVRYVPLCDVYSATSPSSKKVKARKLLPHFDGSDHPPQKQPSSPTKPPIIRVYSRRRNNIKPSSFLDSLQQRTPIIVKSENIEVKEEVEFDDVNELVKEQKKRRKRKIIQSTTEVINFSRTRSRKTLNDNNNNKGANSVKRQRQRADDARNETQLVISDSIHKKRWILLSFDGVDPKHFIGFQCKVYWPLDADWYCGRVVGYDFDTDRHHVEYADGDKENLILSNERIKFYISVEEMQNLKLSCKVKGSEADGLDANEMVALAASLDDCHELEPGDIIWAKITGHAMWPAIVLDESLGDVHKGLSKISGDKSVTVQFFGTHDFARIKTTQVISFLKGLLSSFHLKCKKSNFVRSLEEAKLYLSELKLPKRMLQLRNGVEADDYEKVSGEGDGDPDSGEEYMGDEGIRRKLKELPTSKLSSKISKLTSERYQDLPVGYRPVHVKWKDLDKCNVCHMDEEYENNLFLQCDKCRMMVHAKCYGELEPVDGKLWLCNLCCPGALDLPPPCSLCPLIGGAMKPTTDGRWAHLACAIWIPETCLSDVRKMEPIDGLSRINKDRWKLLCSICGVSYGACIQCSNSTCRVAYHPLCARAAGFCAEHEEEDRLHLMPVEEDDENQCIRLLSFCKKHRPPSNERLSAKERIWQTTHQFSDYTPPPNPSGCARSEPYNYFGRRGRKEPEALAAASLKRLYVENRTYLVGGYCRHELLGSTLSSNTLVGSKFSFSFRKLKTSQLDASKSILSVAEKYKYMKETFRKRLAFGKSGIHGFGIFAKHPHIAGDMVIEYTGELVRPSIADRREHLIYNSLVGAGTYMFRIDEERVIDATRAGSIAHLINHSCEPNCYSRGINFNGDQHIIIFAKRDIKEWEELTYDYRFLGIGEQLACYCGFPLCRGVVNDTEAEEQVAKIFAPRNELIDWSGE